MKVYDTTFILFFSFPPPFSSLCLLAFPLLHLYVTVHCPPLHTSSSPSLPPSSLSCLSLPSEVLLLGGKAALNGLGAAPPCIFNGHAWHAGISTWIMHTGWVRERGLGEGVKEDTEEREKLWNWTKDENKRRQGMGDHCGQKACRESKKDGMRGGNREIEMCILE